MDPDPDFPNGAGCYCEPGLEFTFYEAIADSFSISYTPTTGYKHHIEYANWCCEPNCRYDLTISGLLSPGGTRISSGPHRSSTKVCGKRF